jgi:prephenate dehydrogenase
LIGGSLLRAATAAGIPAWGYNRSAEVVAAARTEGFDATADLAIALTRAASEQALIVIAVPLPAVAATLTAIAEIAPGCAITDVVSVKSPVAAAVARQGLTPRFVGGHPMAGTSESGWAAADGELFRAAAWVVATDDDVDPQVWLRVARLALAAGAVVVPAGSADHDRAVARISHLPHVLAEALALTGAAGGELALGLAAGSFRDGTRVAGSSPALVQAMCEGNAASLVDVLDEVQNRLIEVRRALAGESSADSASFGEFVRAGHAARRRYRDLRRWDITGILPGEDGWQERLREAGRRGGVIRTLDADGQIRSARPV